MRQDCNKATDCASCHQDDGRLLGLFLKQSDQEAFRKLVVRYEKGVYATCLRGAGFNHAQAQDMTQAVFILLVRKAKKLQRRHNLGGWLHITACQVCRTMMRTEKRRAAIRQDAGASIQQSLHGETDGEVMQPALSEHLDDCLEALPQRQREAMVMHHVHGMTVEEIAVNLDIPVETVRSRLRIGRNKLRSKLTKYGLILPATLLNDALQAEAAAAEMPAGLADGCVQAAMNEMAGTPNGPADSIAKQTEQQMFRASLSNTLTIAAATATVAVCTGLFVIYSQPEPEVQTIPAFDREPKLSTAYDGVLYQFAVDLYENGQTVIESYPFANDRILWSQTLEDAEKYQATNGVKLVWHTTELYGYERIIGKARDSKTSRNLQLFIPVDLDISNQRAFAVLLAMKTSKCGKTGNFSAKTLFEDGKDYLPTEIPAAISGVIPFSSSSSFSENWQHATMAYVQVGRLHDGTPLFETCTVSDGKTVLRGWLSANRITGLEISFRDVHYEFAIPLVLQQTCDAPLFSR